MFGNMGGNMGDMTKMIAKYKKLQDALKNTVIRAKEEGIVVDITSEMKIKDVKIEDDSMMDPSNKELLEKRLVAAIAKGQAKAQEVAMEKTKEILGFDPSELTSQLGMGGGGGIPGLS